MPRPHVILQSTFPYNVSARCINRDWFDLPLEEVWNILCEELYMATILHSLQIHSFILMGNHFHLIVTTPKANLSEAMKRFMEITSKRIGKESNRINQIWGARYYKTVLGNYFYYQNAYKYNYFNPVKAGIVTRCEEYRFSTLRALIGYEKLLVPLIDDTLLIPEIDQTLQWLNRHPTTTQLEAIRSSLRKAEFSHVKCRNLRKPILKDDEVI